MQLRAGLQHKITAASGRCTYIEDACDARLGLRAAASLGAPCDYHRSRGFRNAKWLPVSTRPWTTCCKPVQQVVRYDWRPKNEEMAGGS